MAEKILNKVKISDDQFIGVPELNKLKKLLQEQGANHLWRNMIESFGIVSSPNDTNFTYFKVSTNPIGGANTILVSDGIAIDEYFNVIVHANDDYNRAQLNTGISIPNGTNYLFMSHKVSNWEEGEVTISSTGVVTGTDTKFTEVLRAATKFPMKISFIGLNNAVSSEYEVVSVSSDTICAIKGSSFPTGRLYYKVVGSFDYSKTIPAQNKDIYEYGGAQFRASVSSTPNAGEIPLAIIVVAGGTVTNIFDIRAQNMFKLTQQVGSGVLKNSELNDLTNSITGIEFEEHTEDSAINRVKVAWGLRSADWSYNANLSEFTFTSISSGGIYGDDISNVPSGLGDLNFMVGWRVYSFTSGEYSYHSRVISASNVAGLIIQTDSGRKDASSTGAPYDIVVVPDGDYIEIKMHGVTGVLGGLGVEPSARIGNNNRRTFKSEIFPIFSQYAVMDIDVSLRNGTQIQTSARLHQDGVTTKFTAIKAGDYYGADKFNKIDGVVNAAAVKSVDLFGRWTPTKREWTALTLVNGWGSVGTAYLEYIVDGGTIHIRGLLQNTTTAPTGSTITTLPIGFRPSKDVSWMLPKVGYLISRATAMTSVKISSTGAIQWNELGASGLVDLNEAKEYEVQLYLSFNVTA